MADITQTATSVRKTATTTTKSGTAGTTVVPGDWVYKAAGDGELYLGNSSSATLSAVVGMILIAADDGDATEYATGGDVDVGGAGTIGAPAFLSANSGKMKETLPAAGEYNTNLGGFTTAANFEINIQALGVAHA